MVLHLCADVSTSTPRFSYQDVYNQQSRDPVYWSLYERRLLPQQVYHVMATAPYLRPVGMWQRSTEYEFIEEYRQYARPPEQSWRFACKSQTVNEVVRG